ncbi:MAG TPA: ABC transporter ATP-binding protein, partial [Actinotalea sp.]|nr:ABC transporter ATP-binding protein [Actinotalea sp.]
GDAGTVRLTVAGGDPGTLAPDLRAALGRRPGAGAAPAVTVTGGGQIEVGAPADPALLHAVTGWAQDAGLLVTSLTTGRRTLEDVVLDLTGRELR